MEVQHRNDASIYCLSAGPTLPEWLGERARRNLSKRDESIRRRIELLQDFTMPSSSSKVVQSSDGRYIVAAGTYPPRIRCYDVHDLTMKFERYVNSHIVDVTLLGDDYGKIALLLDDRTIAFHAPYGAHESIRIPTFGRAMGYEPSNCELLVAAKGTQLYRLNLEDGRFCEPWSFEPTAASSTCIAVSPAHPLAAVGGDDGIVRFWDNRVSDSLLKPFLQLDVHGATAGYGYADDSAYGNSEEITSIAHDPSGMYMAAATAGGVVALYDVRSSRPMQVMEHKHGMPVHTLQFHAGSGNVLSSDEKLVKIWRYKPACSGSNSSRGSQSACGDNGGVGSVVANVEGTGKFTHFITAGDELDSSGQHSGLILCATDQPKLDSFYVPSLGLAPKWCSFLDNITEELEERDLARDGNSGGAEDLVRDGKESIYENYKFVGRDEVETLGISNLVGTPLLRGYMHGFFMDIQLYNRVRAVANPFEYEEYRKKKLKERIEAKQSSRIAPKQSGSKKTSKHAVNPELAERLMEKSGDRTKSGKVASRLLSDDRFGALFKNPDFQIDEGDINFKLRNPSGVAVSKRRIGNDFDSDEDNSDGEEHTPLGFQRVENDEDQDQDAHTEGSDDSDDEEDGFRGAKVRGEMYEAMKEMERAGKASIPSMARQMSKPKKKNPRMATMYEADDFNDDGRSALDIGLGDASSSNHASHRKIEMSMPLEDRLKMKKSQQELDGTITRSSTKGVGVSREVTYVPKDVRKKMEESKKRRDQRGEDASGGRRRKRRGVKELGFKTPFKNT